MDIFIPFFLFREDEYRQILIDRTQQRKQYTKFLQSKTGYLHTVPWANLLQFWCIYFNDVLNKTFVI